MNEFVWKELSNNTNENLNSRKAVSNKIRDSILNTVSNSCQQRYGIVPTKRQLRSIYNKRNCKERFVFICIFRRKRSVLLLCSNYPPASLRLHSFLVLPLLGIPNLIFIVLTALGCVHSWCWRGIFHWRECWANNLLAANIFYVHSCWPGQHPACWAGQQAACWICWRAQHSRRSITYRHRSARLRSPHYCSLFIVK